MKDRIAAALIIVLLSLSAFLFIGCSKKSKEPPMKGKTVAKKEVEVEIVILATGSRTKGSNDEFELKIHPALWDKMIEEVKDAIIIQKSFVRKGFKYYVIKGEKIEPKTNGKIKK